MGTINCHFVTRSFTEPWELKNRKLKYFDFTLKQLGEDDSLTLFAQVRVHAFVKKTEKTPKHEIELGQKRLREMLNEEI